MHRIRIKGGHRMQRSLDDGIRLIPQGWRLPRTAVYYAAALYASATLNLTVEASRIETIAGDIAFTAWVQSISAPGVTWFVSALNWLGRPLPLVALTILMAGLLANYRRYAEIALIGATAFVHAVNHLLKVTASSPRPTSDVVRVSDQAAGFGFPSGHTMALVVFCGVAVYLAWRASERRSIRVIVLLAAVVIVPGVGFSRIYSGAHWPTDVLGAYLWGTIYTLLLIAAFRWFARSSERIPDSSTA
jgi:undecaprenyl-diphosphatase